MAIELDESSIIKANFQFWDQMLAMKLDPLPCADRFCLESGHALGTVCLSGAWNGQVEIRMEEGLTNTATAAMLMQPVGAVVEADRTRCDQRDRQHGCRRDQVLVAETVRHDCAGGRDQTRTVLRAKAERTLCRCYLPARCRNHDGACANDGSGPLREGKCAV